MTTTTVTAPTLDEVLAATAKGLDVDPEDIGGRLGRFLRELLGGHNVAEGLWSDLGVEGPGAPIDDALIDLAPLGWPGWFYRWCCYDADQDGILDPAGVKALELECLRSLYDGVVREFDTRDEAEEASDPRYNVVSRGDRFFAYVGPGDDGDEDGR